MKRRLRKGFKLAISYGIVSMIIFLFLVRVLNFHRDGSVLTNGSYTFYANNTTYNLDIEDADLTDGANIRFWLTEKDAAWQHFQLSYIGDGLYYISDLSNTVRVGVNEDGDLEAQDLTDGDEQKWRIERIGSSQYYNIYNAENGHALKYIEKTKKYFKATTAEFDESDKTFRIRIIK